MTVAACIIVGTITCLAGYVFGYITGARDGITQLRQVKFVNLRRRRGSGGAR